MKVRDLTGIFSLGDWTLYFHDKDCFGVPIVGTASIFTV